MLKSFFRFLLQAFYGFEARNEKVLAAPGPVLLIPNHVSWLDWLFLYVCLDDDWKFVTSSVTAQTSWLHRKIMINRHTFPIDTTSPYAVKRMAEFLQQGGRLVLFAEGRISITGALMKLFEGTGFLLYKTQVPVITAYLRNASRIPFVRHGGRTRWFPKVSAHFSAVQPPPRLSGVSTTEARKRLTNWLFDQMTRQQFEVEMEHGPKTPLAAIAETAALMPRHVVLEDATRQALTYKRLCLGVRLLSEQWKKLFPGDARRIGVLLPNVNATPVAILSLWAAGKIPAVLNFSTGAAMMLSCAQLAGLKFIVTSRAFAQKAKLDLEVFLNAGVTIVYLEDARAGISGGQKFSAVLAGAISPRPAWGSAPLAPNETAVILFTSGSEGVPKGVELTHSNLLANIRQMLAVMDLQDHDRLFNALPLFHSFGLTVGTLLPLARGLYVFLYLSPLHYRIVPSAVYDRACTVMLGTNTFLNGYARKAHPYDFRSLRYLFGAAEKLQDSTVATWSRQFGVRILEGYGATECAPCLSVNTGITLKYGSAGKLLPGVEYKLEPVEGVAEGGRLLVRGPNIMKGYLNPDANAQFKALDGWYDTGDIVQVDAEGFVTISGRLKRFAKVSGEMVSLTAVENALAGAFPHYGLRCTVAVVSRPDEDKGEMLIAISNEPKLKLEEIRAAIRAAGLSNLAAPRSIQYVREIPKLGTGKVNYRELDKMIQTA